MFTLPPVIKTEVFATLPPSLRNPEPPGAAQIGGRQGAANKHCVLEGPSFDREGNLYFVDIPFGRVLRASPQGVIDLVTQYDGEPNGLKIHKDGRIFIADHRNGIMLLDAGSGKVTPFLEGPPKERFKGVNDLVFGNNGDLYFTDHGHTSLHDPTGRVYRLRADGRLQCLLNNIPSPNGLALDPTENILYVAVTRDACVWEVPLADGELGRVGIFVRCSFGGCPDGLAMDEAGNLAVTRFMYQEVWLFSKRCVPICRIVPGTGQEHITNLAYGGEGNKTLFITEVNSGSILMAQMEVPGKILYSHL